MYLVSTYWRGALNIGDMRLLTTADQVKERLQELWPETKNDNFEDFFANGTWRCRVYEFIPNDSKGPKILTKKKLKELLL